MTFALRISAATCCCALWTVSAAAETCDQRYPGSCRVETSTTVVQTKGETPAAAPRAVATRAAAPRHSRRTKRAAKHIAAKHVAAKHVAAKHVAAKHVVKRVRVASAIAPLPLPRPAPQRVLTGSDDNPASLVSVAAAKPTNVVDEAFNTLTASDATDPALEQALISWRDRMTGFALR